MNSDSVPPDASLPEPLDLTAFGAFLVAKGVAEQNFKDLRSMAATEITGRFNRFNRICTAFELFHMKRQVPEWRVIEFLAPYDLESIIQLGLLDRYEHGVGSQFQVDFFQGFPIYHPSVRPGVGNPGNIRLSEMLAAFTPKQRVDSALIYGSEEGRHTTLAARHCTFVDTVESSFGALNIAECNARLNAANHTRFQTKRAITSTNSTYDLIAGRLEPILPPEVHEDGAARYISCEEFLHEDLCSLAKRLKSGAYAVLALDWASHTKDAWTEFPSYCIEGFDCDVWWFRNTVLDKFAYAGIWYPDRSECIAYEECINYYSFLGAHYFSRGIAVLRKRAARGGNWDRFEDFSDLPDGIHFTSCGDQIETIFRAETFFVDCESDADLLDERFHIHSSHSVRIEAKILPGSKTDTVSARLQSTQGILYVEELSPLFLQVLHQFDGTRSLREVFCQTLQCEEAEVVERSSEHLGQIASMFRKGLIVRATS